MRLTLIIVSAIFFALMAYARLLAVVHDASIPTLYEGAAPHQTIQAGPAASRSN